MMEEYTMATVWSTQLIRFSTCLRQILKNQRSAIVFMKVFLCVCPFVKMDNCSMNYV